MSWSCRLTKSSAVMALCTSQSAGQSSRAHHHGMKVSGAWSLLPLPICSARRDQCPARPVRGTPDACCRCRSGIPRISAGAGNRCRPPSRISGRGIRLKEPAASSTSPCSRMYAPAFPDQRHSRGKPICGSTRGRVGSWRWKGALVRIAHHHQQILARLETHLCCCGSATCQMVSTYSRSSSRRGALRFLLAGPARPAPLMVSLFYGVVGGQVSRAYAAHSAWQCRTFASGRAA